MNLSTSGAARQNWFSKGTSLLSMFLKNWAKRQHQRQQVKRMRGTEALEDRTLLAAFTVTNLNDTGTGSLRQAISDANGAAGADTITFQSGLTGTITLGGAHLVVSDAVEITGPAQGITIDANNASRIFDHNSPLTLRNLTLTGGNGNKGTTASSFNNDGLGGAISGNGGGRLTLINSTVTGNSANDGGGIFNRRGVIVINSTISGNTADGFGGGLGLYGVVPHRITNSTITGNHADFNNDTSFQSGGGIDFLDGTLTLENTIVAGNFVNAGTAASDLNVGSSTLTGFNNLIGDAGSSGGLTNGKNGNIVGNGGAGTLDITSVLNTTLTNNGGPTQTHALVTGSLAINAGDNARALDESNQPLMTDQRGTPLVRVFGGTVDIGAYELISNLVVSTLADESDGDLSDGDLSLREAIEVANAQPGTETITFKSGLSGTITLGGAHLVVSDALEITGPAQGITIDANKASRIFDHNSPLTLRNLTLAGGNGTKGTAATSFSLDGIGGAISGFNGSPALTLINSTVTGNSVAIEGGGIWNSGGAVIINSTISENTADDSGGGFFAFDGTIIINSTISGNTANLSGGGLLLANGATHRITNSTITGNHADFDNNSAANGGGIFLSSGTLTLENTIVAGNFADAGTVANDLNVILGFSTLTGFNNLIGDAATSGGLTHGTNGNIVGNKGAGTLDINTVLNTTLANNGGPTQTHALVTGSLAINAGNNALALDESKQPLTTDQRGLARIDGGTVDIGAFELVSNLVVSTLVDESDGDFSDGDLSLREAIEVANAQPGTETITFKSGLAGTITLGGAQLVVSDALEITGPAQGITIDGNKASRIFNHDSPLTLRNLTLTGGNGTKGTATTSFGLEGLGGAIHGTSGIGGATLTLINSTVTGNSVAFDGGGIRNFGGATIINSTISGNTAGGFGGGLALRGGVGPHRITNSTITGNHADFDNSDPSESGGGIDLFFTTLTLENTIVAGNFVDAGTKADDLNVESNATLTGFNTLIGDAATSGGLTNDGTNGNIIGNGGAGTLDISTVLNTTLANNGGPTQTHALVMGSLAINAGDNARALDESKQPLTTDQRGLARIDGGTVDIGAFEFVASPTPEIDFGLATYSTSEANATNTTNVVILTRTGDTSSTSSVDVVLTGTTATSGSDFTAGPVTVMFGAGETMKAVPIEILGDMTVELDELLDLSLTNFVNSSAGATQPTSQLTITNDDSATISVTNVNQNELNSGKSFFSFAISIDNPVDTGVSFTLDDVAVTAIEGQDYAAFTVPFPFSTGSSPLSAGTIAKVDISVLGDTTVELDETFLLRLSGLSASGRNVQFNGGGKTLDGTATIKNDDSAKISISDAKVTEGGMLAFDVTIDNAVDVAITADRKTQDGTALTGDSDYTGLANSNVQLFAAGSTSKFTISVATTGDNKVELDETLSLILSNLGASGRAVTFADDTGVGTITNDDSALITISDAKVTEGGQLSFDVTIDNPVDVDITADRETADGTALVSNSDYSAITKGNVTLFTAGSTTTFTITVNTTSDGIVEPDETLSLILSNLMATGRDVTFNGMAATLTGTGIITNDDTTTLTVTIDKASISENGGTATGTVTRSGSTASALTVNLSSSDTGEAKVQASVMIPAGKTSATFTITGQSDGIVDATQTVTITASAATASDGTDTVDVLNTDALIVSTLVDESDGNFSVGDLSLREAIELANAQPGSDTITFAPGLTGTISLTMGALTISDGLLLAGPGSRDLTIDGDNAADHVFLISNNDPSLTDNVLVGITITGGKRGVRNEENLTIENSVITGNSTLETGGGINHEFGELVLRSTEVSANTSSFGIGGGMELNSGNVFLINSTISGNQSTGNGGGIAIHTGTTVTIINSTITGNTADSDGKSSGIGGGIWNFGDLTLHNTIIGGNLRNGVASDIQGTNAKTAVSAHNLIGDAATSGGIVQGGDLANIVGLGGSGTRNISTVINTTLADNGGTGPRSHALVPGSLAIDNGNTVKATEPGGATLTVDQNGNPRVIDGDGDGKNIVDIGSLEAGPMAVNGTLIFDQSNGKWRLGTVSGSTLNWFQTGAFGANQRGFIGDFNGDGLLDGMMLNTTNLRFNFLRNKGDGTLAAPVSAGALSSQFTWDNFMVGDYDGNGRAEVMAQIVSTGFGQGAMRSQDFQGVNRFYVTLNTGFDAMATGDFNGDGWDDVVGLFDNVNNTRANIIPAYSIRTPVGRRFTTVLASGQFGQSVSTGGLHDLTVDDFNGDGRDDIAVVNFNGQIFTASTVGNPRSNAADVQNFVVSAASPRFDPATYSNPILSGNFNDDLFSDIFTIRDNDQLITAISSLAGNKTPIQTLGISGMSSVGESAVIGDFNGDGLEDLIVLGATASRYLSMGTTFGGGLNFGNVIGGAIGQIGAARAGRVV